MSNLLPEGRATFTIRWAEQHTSRAGNPSLKLRLEVESGGQTAPVYEYLSYKSPKRLESFLGALRHNPLDKELADASDEELSRLKGLNGEVKIRIEKSDNEQYPDKNRVAFWEPNKERVKFNAALASTHKTAETLSRTLRPQTKAVPMTPEEDSFWKDIPEPGDVDIDGNPF